MPKGSKKARQGNTEFDLQVSLVDFLLEKYPNVIFRSDLGGIRLPIGLARKTKKLFCGSESQGKKIPYPDFFIIEPRGGWAGLFIELKRLSTLYAKGPLSNRKLLADPHVQEQATILLELRKRGFYADFAGGSGEVFHLVRWYLSLTVEDRPTWEFSALRSED